MSDAIMQFLPPYRSTSQSPLFDTTLLKCTGAKRRYFGGAQFAKIKVTRLIAAARALQTMQKNGMLRMKARA